MTPFGFINGCIVQAFVVEGWFIHLAFDSNGNLVHAQYIEREPKA